MPQGMPSRDRTPAASSCEQRLLGTGCQCCRAEQKGANTLRTSSHRMEPTEITRRESCSLAKTFDQGKNCALTPAGLLKTSSCSFTRLSGVFLGIENVPATSRENEGARSLRTNSKRV
jgi:hypothetical protein